MTTSVYFVGHTKAEAQVRRDLCSHDLHLKISYAETYVRGIWDRIDLRQKIFLAAEKFYNDIEDRTAAKEVAIRISGHGVYGTRQGPESFEPEDWSFISRIENEVFKKEITQADVQLYRWQFWCFVEMRCFKVIPSDLLKFWDTEAECTAMIPKLVALESEVLDMTPEQRFDLEGERDRKRRRAIIRRVSDETPVLRPKENWREFVMLYLAAYPADYMTSPQNTVSYMTRPVPPTDPTVTPLHKSLAYWRYYGITRLAQAELPKPRDPRWIYAKPSVLSLESFMGKTGDFRKFSPGGALRDEIMTMLVKEFFEKWTDHNKPLLGLMADAVIALHYKINDLEAYTEYLDERETEILGAVVTEGSPPLRRTFWDVMRAKIAEFKFKERDYDQMVSECVRTLLLNRADPEDLAKPLFDSRGGVSAPITAEEHQRLPRKERILYRPLWIMYIFNIERYRNSIN